MVFCSTGAAGSNSFAVRSHTCGELRKCDAGAKVKLFGWVQHQRLNKFVVLRDAYGVTQLVVPAEVREFFTYCWLHFHSLAFSIQRQDLAEKIRDAPLESVVAVDGEVCERPPGQSNLVRNRQHHSAFRHNLISCPNDRTRLLGTLKWCSTVSRSFPLQPRTCHSAFMTFQRYTFAHFTNSSISISSFAG